MVRKTLLILALASAPGCKHEDKPAPSAHETASGSATAGATGSDPGSAGVASGAAAGSGSETGSAGDSGTAGSGSATGEAAGSAETGSAAEAGSAASDPSAACEAYYQAEVKFAEEEHRKPSGKHDAFVAACRKLPAELQTCQADASYAVAHDDACTKLLSANVKAVQALRRMVAGM